jgi:hypothetical protein
MILPVSRPPSPPLEEAIDSRAYRFPGNDPVMDLADQLKEQYRQAIRD